MAVKGVAWFDVDSVTPSSGNVSEFINKLNGAHKWTQATAGNRVAMPTAKAALGGALAVSLNGGQFYEDNQAASFWRRRHDGSSWAEFALVVPTNSAGTNALNTIVDTTDAVSGRSGAILSYAGTSTSAAFVSIQNASAQVALDNTGAMPNGVGTWFGYSCTSNVFTRYVKTTAHVLTTNNTPLNGNPANTVRFGNRWAATQQATVDCNCWFALSSAPDASELSIISRFMKWKTNGAVT